MPAEYRTIVADPPWPYKGVAVVGGKPEDVQVGVSYPVLSIADISSLPVSGLADSAAHLYLWTTNAFMAEAHEVSRAWGFRPKTICTWGKVQADGRPSMKAGYWFRGATEHCLFAVRGKLRFPDGLAEPTLWLWPRLPHSVKPGAFYDLVERVSPGPRLELFARTQRLGWDSWGNEALCHVTLEPRRAG